MVSVCTSLRLSACLSVCLDFDLCYTKTKVVHNWSQCLATPNSFTAGVSLQTSVLPSVSPSLSRFLCDLLLSFPSGLEEQALVQVFEPGFVFVLHRRLRCSTRHCLHHPTPLYPLLPPPLSPPPAPSEFHFAS